MSCQCRWPQCVKNRLRLILQCLRCNHCCNRNVTIDNELSDIFTTEADLVREVFQNNSNQRNITARNQNIDPDGFTELEDGLKNDMNHDDLIFDNIEIGDLSYRAITDGYESPDQNDVFDGNSKNTKEDKENDDDSVIIDNHDTNTFHSYPLTDHSAVNFNLPKV